MSKHTPGPWTLSSVTCKSGRNKLALSSSKARICDISVYEDEDRANARLIAAAPELYEACEILLKRFGKVSSIGTGGLYDIVDRARAAIVKATGEQS